MFDTVEYLETACSTNSLLLNGGYDDTTVLYTFHQTAGRGRFDRVWETGSGDNLALSVLFIRPEIPAVWLTALLSVALRDTLVSCHVEDVWIKWPNDVYAGKSKIAGVLTESRWTDGIVDRAVAGVGVNVNAPFSSFTHLDRPVASVFTETGVRQDLHGFTREYIGHLKKYVNESGGLDSERIKSRWIEYSSVIGKTAIISEMYNGSRVVRGVISRVDDDGYLYIIDGGIESRVVTGDITIEI